MIPGLESLECLFAVIWQKVNSPNLSLEEIKSAILYDLFGQIKREDLNCIHSSLKFCKTDRDHVWAHLVETKIIDGQGKFLVKDTSEITKEKINYVQNPAFNSTLAFFLKNILTRKQFVQVPKHLLGFVELHLDTFLNNAMQAVFLRPDVDYVVDFDRSRQSADLNPQITIIDKDTGTDQATSQWEGGLHQFLQLKEGCQITPLTLKAVFVSNISYIRHYNVINGLTGTLGSIPEREFLKEMYKSAFIIIPTAFPKQFVTHPAKILAAKQDWLKEIRNEVELMLKSRSLVVFCKTIIDVRSVAKILKNDLKLDDSRLHTYTREFANFQFESDELQVGHVIVATNLAGRGTDIKISKELHDNGGLHICLTYLPENVRIEEQAFGRSGNFKPTYHQYFI